ncbi:hypothetical protein H310_12779 [Aphanomyces invadans]|uniref:TAF1C beta-propeller domain-containing protein n=1 Tax=Aphanomyces invadans TaxID=157072 RepID=A0A024TII5_9STRA|nr:hypothetical protein H310_12779 [Aphanomyces invadans]ETV93172.1 hypothetical protein H310_12779 [Aphanomyces invadans]|eukprot:XP_008878194.1 hypothetical protein H310_12779 [Aphanomyces invadans]
MWEYGLSNFPFVPVEVGLNRRISYTLPSRIPQNCVRLLNASPAREHWECIGVPKLLARNPASYPYHFPNTRLKWQGKIRYADRLFFSKTRATRESRQFQKRFKDSGIPHDVLTDLIHEENRFQERHRVLRSDRQGNALHATTWNDRHVVLYPTGELLHQVQVKYRRGSTAHWHAGPEKPIDIVNRIEQIDLLGTLASGSAKPLRVVVRGAAACHVITFHNAEFTDHTADSIQFPSMLYHVAPSPHVDDEFSCISTSGKLFSWTAAGGAQVVGHAMPQQRWLRCEYSSHPCVLWVANRHAVGTYDNRMPAPQGFNCTDWLVDYIPAPTEIVDIRRHPSCPFQLVVRTDTSLDILDVRSPHKSMVQWRHAGLHPATVTKQPHTIGTVDVLDISSPDHDRAIILSGSAVTNKVSVHWYHGHAADDPTMLSLRGASASQISAADAAFDLHLPDTTPWVHQIGACALRTADDVCDVFQLSSLGDLFVHVIQHNPSDALCMQANVPCGRAMRTAPEDVQHEDPISMPLPAKAFLPEHDAASMQPFRLLHVARLQQTLAPPACTTLPATDRLADLPSRLAALLTPSTTLVAVMRTYYSTRPTYSHLVHAVAALPHVMLRFTTPHARSSQHTLPRRHASDDNRPLCGCHDPISAYVNSSPPPMPCEDSQCPLPHLWIIQPTPPDPPSPKHTWHPSAVPLTNKPLQYDALVNTTSHAQVVVDLEAVYGDSYDALPSSPRRIKQQLQFSW